MDVSLSPVSIPKTGFSLTTNNETDGGARGLTSVRGQALRIGYARVSTHDQSTNLQRDALQASGCAQIFEDSITGTARKREGLDTALGLVGAGDQLVVWRLDRLSRSLRHLIEISELLQARGAHLISLNDGIDTSSSSGEMYFNIIGAIAQFERRLISERTKAGLASARSRGVVLGQKPKMSPAQIMEARALLMSGRSGAQVAHAFGVSRATLYRAMKRA
jgi:DNA invertase Pin-like site-specific DNA recombinase